MRESERLSICLFPTWAFLIIIMGFFFVVVDINLSQRGPGFWNTRDFTDDELRTLSDPYVDNETKEEIHRSARISFDGPSLTLELLPDIIGRIGIVAGAFMLAPSRLFWKLGLFASLGGMVLELVCLFCELSAESDTIIWVWNASSLAQFAIDAFVVFAIWGGLMLISRQMGYKLIERASLATVLLYGVITFLAYSFFFDPTQLKTIFFLAFALPLFSAMGISAYGAMTRL